MTYERDAFDDWEALIEGLRPQPCWPDDFSTTDPPPDFPSHVDLAAGEFFRNTWRRRLADAEGNCGYVARQMRKAGVPLNLALAILLAPDPRPAWLYTSAGPADAWRDGREPTAGKEQDAAIARVRGPGGNRGMDGAGPPPSEVPELSWPVPDHSYPSRPVHPDTFSERHVATGIR